MLSVSVTNSRKVISDLRRDIDQQVRLIAEDLFKTLERYTPKRSGRARSRWRFTGKDMEYQAINDAPYIQRLDNGYSKQSPRGIQRPAIREVANKQRRFK